MVGMQSKITVHAKKQENATHSQNNNQGKVTGIKMTEMMELTHIGVKTYITNNPYPLEVKKITNLMRMEDIKRPKLNIRDKSFTRMKNTPKEIGEEKISEPEDRREKRSRRPLTAPGTHAQWDRSA